MKRRDCPTDFVPLAHVRVLVMTGNGLRWRGLTSEREL